MHFIVATMSLNKQEKTMVYSTNMKIDAREWFI